MKLECPYCNNTLIKGFIDSGRYSFKWYDENMSFLEKYTVFGGEVLGEFGRISCYRCKDCKKIIIDLNEL